MNRRIAGAVSAIVGLVLAGGSGLAYAHGHTGSPSARNTPTRINACVSKKTGATRINVQCNRHERKVGWTRGNPVTGPDTVFEIVADGNTKAVTAQCPRGMRAVGGAWQALNTDAIVVPTESIPSPNHRQWRFAFLNAGMSTETVTAYAECI